MASRSEGRGSPGGRPARVRIRAASGSRALEAALNGRGLGPVAGVDEAGRGACAGPLVVAACILPNRPLPVLAGLDDSKRLGPATRERLFPLIERHAVATTVVVVPAAEVDRLGVHRADIEGMRRAVALLDPAPGYVLSDGFVVPGLAMPSLPIIGGDHAAACVAAASILAKVTRDRFMVELDVREPGYGFATHKGYGTAMHTRTLAERGPCREHRMSYENVRRAGRTRREG